MEDGKRDFKKIIQNFAHDHKSIQQIKFLLEDDIVIEEIPGKGMMNFVFHVHTKDNRQSVIIKYGEEKPKVHVDGLGKVGIARQELEYESLKLLADIYPGSVPLPFCYDAKHNIISMEYLKDMELLGAQLEEGKIDIGAAVNIGTMLATMHNRTSRHLVKQEVWTDLEAKFTQRETRKLVKWYTIEVPFDESSPVLGIPDDCMDTYRKIVDLVKEQGLQKKMSAVHDVTECFLHADCHWNHFAIFPGSERIALFDFEFSFLGNPCFDLAGALVGYAMFCRAMDEKSETTRTTFHQEAKTAVERMVDAYLGRTEIYRTEGSQAELVSHLAISIGCMLFGFSVFQGADILFKTMNKNRLGFMELASHLMQEHEKITTSKQLAEALFPQTT